MRSFLLGSKTEISTAVPYIKTLGTTASCWHMPFSKVGYDNTVAVPLYIKYTVKVYGMTESQNNIVHGTGIGFNLVNLGYYNSESKWIMPSYLGSVWNSNGIVLDGRVDVFEKHTYETGNGSGVGCIIDGVEYRAGAISGGVKLARYCTTIGGSVPTSETFTTISAPSKCILYDYEFVADGVALGKFKPAQKDGVAGMTNELDGDFYPASNCIYGEEPA